MPDDDIAARLRGLAEQMSDVVTIGHEDDPYFGGGDIADVEEAADLIDSLRADNARLTRQLAFDPTHARLTAAAVAIEDSGKLPEGTTTTVSPGGVISFDFGQRFSCTVHPVYGGVRWAWSGHPDHGIRRSGYDAPDPVEAAVAAIAATTEGAT